VRVGDGDLDWKGTLGCAQIAGKAQNSLKGISQFDGGRPAVPTALGPRDDLLRLFPLTKGGSDVPVLPPSCRPLEAGQD